MQPIIAPVNLLRFFLISILLRCLWSAVRCFLSSFQSGTTIGELYPKADGSPYATKKGAFRNHPSTKWAAKNHENTAWLIQHGCALASEYQKRYGKEHTCAKTLFEAKKIFHKKSGKAIVCYNSATDFSRAMPDEFKYDDSIDTFTAYKRYIASKPWVKDNYLRKPERKPSWV